MTRHNQWRRRGGTIALAAFAALATVAGAWALAGSSERPAPTCRGCPTPAERRDRKIAFYKARVSRDPYGARDLAMLGALFLSRARETGSYEDIRRAEDAARTSLAHRIRRNDGAMAILASSYLAEHKFTEAYQVASRLVARDSSDATSRAMLGEIALELGKYGEANRLFGSLATQRHAPALAPRYARWLELRGHTREAYELLRQVRTTMTGAYGVTAEQLAWLDLRIGELAFRAGRLDEAGQAFSSGLARSPDDYRLLGAAARLFAARHDWPRAIATGERAVAGVLDPATLGLLSDCYAAIGDSAKASEYSRAMEVSVSQQPGAFHRAWSLFLLDHDRDVSLVLERARMELMVRRDVYGYDLVAWALHRSGRDREALPLARKALSIGARDAMLYFHAGTIAGAVGDSTQSQSWLQAAKQINPFYEPLAASRQRKE